MQKKEKRVKKEQKVLALPSIEYTSSSPSHLDHNYKIIRESTHDSTQCIGVVKPMPTEVQCYLFCKTTRKLGIDKLAVAYTEEGIQLRKHGIKTPIMVFYPTNGFIKN